MGQMLSLFVAMNTWILVENKLMGRGEKLKLSRKVIKLHKVGNIKGQYTFTKN